MSHTLLKVAPLLAGVLLLADKKAYLADSEAVCGTAKEQLDAIPAPTTPEDARGVFATGLSIVDRTTTRLEDLARDSPDEAKVRRIFLEPLRGQADEIKVFLPKFEAALAKGPEAVAALQQPQLPKADVAAMTAYGFDTCVQLAKQ